MEAVNPLLVRIGRALVEAVVAHAGEDRMGVEGALEDADRLAYRLIDAVGGASALGTSVGEMASMLHSQIEMIEIDAGYFAVLAALGRTVALTILVGRVANGPNPFARNPGSDFHDDDGATPIVPPGAIVRA